MSNIDLASEHLKQQIEAANRESLEHSILTERPMSGLPRAKMTHKGEEVIEDMDLRDEDFGRRIREEEEREWEREKMVKERGRERRMSMGMGMQGPQEILAQAARRAGGEEQARPSASPIVEKHAAAATMTTPTDSGMKIDELINIDIDIPEENAEGKNEQPPMEGITDTNIATPMPPILTSLTTSTSPLTSPTTQTPTSAFNLNSLWSASPTAVDAPTFPQGASASPTIPVTTTDPTREPPSIDIDLGTAAHDEDFDMFLDDHQAEGVDTSTPLLSGPEAEKAMFDSLPVVWSGSVCQPSFPFPLSY